ncbi:MAG: HAD-IIIA family hydrolase [Paludibacteraceae bacterium]|nr:HAD-IIIA family hydrolase [Paludibacteraceae bacterium]
MQAQVVIIAGGKGTRIASIASDIPKSMIPIAGKPVVEYQIELAKRYGYKNILFMIGHLGDQIKRYFGNGEKWGVNIEYYLEDAPMGTAGALPFVKEILAETFFVFYGDTIMDFDMTEMMKFHVEHEASATLFLHPNDHPYDSDLVETDFNGIIKKFIFKPHDELLMYRNLVNAALYVMDKKCIDYIPEGKCAMEKELFPRLLDANEKLAAYASPEYIKDMGTPDRWEHVTADVVSGKVKRLNRKYKRPAVFLDRDGVISKEIDLLHKVEQLELIDGAADAISLINKSGYLAIVVTNQPVIARNLCSFEELQNIHNRMETLLGEKHAYLDAIYFCPHHPDKGYPEERVEYKIDCSCRKPKPGMLLKAAEDLNINMSESFMIGDRPQDIQAGNAANVKSSILIKTNVSNALLNAVKKLAL